MPRLYLPSRRSILLRSFRRPVGGLRELLRLAARCAGEILAAASANRPKILLAHDAAIKGLRAVGPWGAPRQLDNDDNPAATNPGLLKTGFRRWEIRNTLSCPDLFRISHRRKPV